MVVHAFRSSRLKLDEVAAVRCTGRVSATADLSIYPTGFQVEQMASCSLFNSAAVCISVPSLFTEPHVED